MKRGISLFVVQIMILQLLLANIFVDVSYAVIDESFSDHLNTDVITTSGPATEIKLEIENQVDIIDEEERQDIKEIEKINDQIQLATESTSPVVFPDSNPDNNALETAIRAMNAGAWISKPTITVDDMESFTYALNLTRKNITSLDGLEYAKNIQYLYLDFNNISDLPDDIFRDMKDLKYVKLWDNQISHLSPDLFEHNSKLEEAIIGPNKLTGLPENLFANNPLLSHISIPKNEIEDIPPKLFKGLNKLTNLSLYENHIGELPEDVFADLTDLRYLYLNGNKISSLDSGLFKQSTELRTIDLNNNQLETLPSGLLDGLSELKSLYLQKNQLSNLPDGLFKDAGKMDWLRLDYNNLTAIEKGGFDHMTALRKLYLNDNQLTSDDGYGHLASTLSSNLNDNLNLFINRNGDFAKAISFVNPQTPDSSEIIINQGQKLFNKQEDLNNMVHVTKAGHYFGDVLLPQHINNLKIESSDTSVIDEDGNALSAGSADLRIYIGDGHESVVNSIGDTVENDSVWTETFTVIVSPAVTQNPVLNFPDENFRKHIVMSSVILNGRKDPVTGNSPEVDNYLIYESDLSIIGGFTNFSLAVNKKNISDLTGIEYFTGLTKLFVQENNLSRLDLSKNTKLDYLDCSDNKLTDLNIENTQLTTLFFSNNKLKTIDVTPFHNLSRLRGDNNLLSQIDLTKNSGLIQVNVSENSDLSALDLSKNINLETLYCDHTGIDSLDVSKNTKLRYLVTQYTNISELDISKNPDLVYLLCNYTNLKELDLRNNIALEHLACGNTEIESLDLGANNKLWYLNASNSKLFSLDISQNPELFYLYAENNKLLSLDISKNTKLAGLWADNQNSDSVEMLSNGERAYEIDLNQIRNLTGGESFNREYAIPKDATSYTEGIASYDTKPSILEYTYDLNFKNFSMAGIKVSLNESNLYQVRFLDYDDSLLKTETVAKGSDATPPENPLRDGYVFSGWDSAYTNVQGDLAVKALYDFVVFPDNDSSNAKLEEAIRALDPKFQSPNVITDRDMASLKDQLILTGKEITGLNGLQYAININHLRLNFNQISDFPKDIFKNMTQLKTLNLANNEIEDLPADLLKDLSDLEALYLDDNRISSLSGGPFDGLIHLEKLHLSGNSLDSLPVELFSKTDELETLHMEELGLKTLPKGIFDNLKKLRVLFMSANELEAIPEELFKNQSKLEWLDIKYNRLADLPLNTFDNTLALIRLELYDNQLTSKVAYQSLMDQLVSDTNRIDGFNLFPKNTGYQKQLSVKEDTTISLKVGESLETNLATLFNQLEALPKVYSDPSLVTAHLNNLTWQVEDKTIINNAGVALSAGTTRLRLFIENGDEYLTDSNGQTVENPCVWTDWIQVTVEANDDDSDGDSSDGGSGGGSGGNSDGGSSNSNNSNKNKDKDDRDRTEQVDYNSRKYMIGMPDGQFMPDKYLSRAELVVLLDRFYELDHKHDIDTSYDKYSDVDTSKWYGDAINRMTQEGLVKGYEDGTFRPDNQITREELSQIIFNMFDIGCCYTREVQNDYLGNRYNDIYNLWSSDALIGLQIRGLLQDFQEETFHPNQPITRGETVLMLNRYFGYDQGYDQSFAVTFKDIDVSSPLAVPIALASQDHLITSTFISDLDVGMH